MTTHIPFSYMDLLYYQISAAAENTIGKLQRVRCNSYSLGVSKVRDMFRSRGGSGRNSGTSSRSRLRTRSVRFREQLGLGLEDDFSLMTATTAAAAAATTTTTNAVNEAKAVEGADCGSPQVMEMSMIRAKSEPSGIARVV